MKKNFLLGLIETTGVTFAIYFFYLLIFNIVPTNIMDEVNRLSYFGISNIVAMGCFTIGILTGATKKFKTDIFVIAVSMALLYFAKMNIVALSIGGVVALITIYVCDVITD